MQSDHRADPLVSSARGDRVQFGSTNSCTQTFSFSYIQFGIEQNDKNLHFMLLDCQEIPIFL